ncbi:hypothetical protein TW65_08295 [Stemphylium lycopersici]|nr:hypothetical protein TW65_08295 [Stemphylium lycopersici]
MARKQRNSAQKEDPVDEEFVEDQENESGEDDLGDEQGPPTIDPYEVLGLEAEATAEDVKKAYRKMALKCHPDKAAPDEKEAANRAFQEIAFAYAVLSDDRRRKRYDLTGSTAETMEDDDDFNWLKFYREQFENVVNEEAINNVANEYKGSEEERNDLIKAYKKVKGNLNKVYDLVMLSDILVDDDRFRQIFDEEIENGTIESYPAYAKETDATRQKAKDAEKKRREAFDKEQAQEQEQEEAAPAKGKSKAKAKPKAKKSGTDDMAGLAALIQQRQKARAGNFFDSLEAKYAPKSRGSKRSTPMDMDEPPEEAFEANRKKQKTNSRSSKKAREDSDQEMESGEEDIGDSEEEESPPPKQKPRPKRTKVSVFRIDSSASTSHHRSSPGSTELTSNSTMVSKSKTPTARKGPVSLSISFNGSAKTKTQNTASPTRPPKKNHQQRKMSAFQNPVTADNKRKIDFAHRFSSNDGKTQGIIAASPHLETAIPLKKQKFEIEEPNAESKSPPNFHPLTPSQTPKPSDSPQHESTQTAPSQAIQISTTLLAHVLQTNPNLLPANPFTSPITSSHIDAIAHTIWQVAFSHGDLLQRACQYGSLFSPLKLAALAKLNFLPSWWFFRDLAVRYLKEKGGRERWVVDDGDMEGVWGEAVRWCVGVREERDRVNREDGKGEGEGEEGGSEMVRV